MSFLVGFMAIIPHERVIESVNAMITLLESSPRHKVHLLVNLSGVQETSSVNSRREALHKLLTHPKLGVMVAYGLDNGMARRMAMLLAVIFRTPIKIVANYSDAINILQSHLNIPDALSQIPEPTDAHEI